MTTTMETSANVERLLSGYLPSTYLAAHIFREDENMFQETADKDVRRSIRVGEVPLPELAPGLEGLSDVDIGKRVGSAIRHVGKIGVLCLAQREGLGIEDPDLRGSLGEERLRLFRDCGRV